MNIKNALPDWLYFQLLYIKHFGRLGRFNNPTRFSEKLFARMLSPLPEFSMLANKIAVREYVKNTVGGEYLIPMFGSFDYITRDVFSQLPDNIVIKGNHGAGQVIVIRNKNDVEFDWVQQKTNQWMASIYGLDTRQRHYGQIVPRLIVEEALLEEGGLPNDYKVHVLKPGKNGRPFFFIQIISGREREMAQALYTEKWEKAPFWRAGYKDTQVADRTPKPEQLQEMLSVADQLTGSLGYARVDFYIHKGKLYFGEITLTPVGGRLKLMPRKFDIILGHYIAWPERFAPI